MTTICLATAAASAEPSPAKDSSLPREATASSDRAQSLFDEARVLIAQGRPSDACPKLEESQRLDPALGTLLNLADCYEHDDRAALAWKTFEQARQLAHKGGHSVVERVAAERAEAIATRLPRLVLKIASPELPGLSIALDGESIERPLWTRPIVIEPGLHLVSARAPGHAGRQFTVRVPAGSASLAVEIPSLTKQDIDAEQVDARTALSTRRLWAAGSAGVGVVGVMVGAVFGLRSIQQKREADEHCRGPACTDQTGVELRQRALQSGNVSTVAFVVGLAGMSGGAVLWFSEPSADGTSLRLQTGFTSVSVGGSW